MCSFRSQKTCESIDTNLFKPTYLINDSVFTNFIFPVEHLSHNFMACWRQPTPTEQLEKAWHLMLSRVYFSVVKDKPLTLL